ncbi:MAG: hypothetical protein HUU06_05940 [Planctomycetaceae bacterium]|nr:hypothetical protein [Planctomycetota bacterium]NUN52313.1 hypothetical protein [Planctomycetaceae bacterium]
MEVVEGGSGQATPVSREWAFPGRPWIGLLLLPVAWLLGVKAGTEVLWPFRPVAWFFGAAVLLGALGTFFSTRTRVGGDGALDIESRFLLIPWSSRRFAPGEVIRLELGRRHFPGSPWWRSHSTWLTLAVVHAGGILPVARAREELEFRRAAREMADALRCPLEGTGEAR